MRSVGQAADRVVERLDPHPGEAPVVLDARLRDDLVPVLGDRRVVELQDQARLDDRRVLLAHRVGAGPEHLLVVGVVLVAEARAAGRRDRVEEAVGDARRPPARPSCRRCRAATSSWPW